MKKLCDSCVYYADMFNFCCVKYVETGKNLVEYCENYKEKRHRNEKRTENGGFDRNDIRAIDSCRVRGDRC